MATTLTPPTPSRPFPPPNGDVATAWAFLEEGIDHIMIQTISYPRWMALYTVVYNYETAGHGYGRDLYNKLNEYFITHIEGLEDQLDSLHDVALLEYYVDQWDNYATGARYINRLFTYLNRHWVRSERGEGQKGVYPVYILALVLWRSKFFLRVQSKEGNLTRTILRLIDRQRNGDTIDQSLIKKVVDSFVSLGLDPADIRKVSLDVYKEHFELPFLEATEEYYEQESKAFFAEGSSFSDYLKKVEGRLREEEDRAHLYLNTEAGVRKCEDVLIKPHLERMWDSFKNLLDSDSDGDLRRMFALLSRIPGGLEPIWEKFEEHVKNAGLEKALELVGNGLEGGDGLPVDPMAYVDVLFEVLDENSEIVTRTFGGEEGFVASLDRACRVFVNYNAATGTSGSRSPEVLAKYVDTLLRKKTGTEGDIEGASNRVVTLLKYIEEKDVFQTFYSRKLSERLIHRVSTSDESERNMALKLEKACGRGYIKVLRDIFADKDHSKDLTDQFKEKMRQNHDIAIDMSIMVFRAASWPLDIPNHYFIVPPEILPAYGQFPIFYQEIHRGRKLIWLWNYSKNELQTNHFNQKYILTTTSYQMAVLLQYNAHYTRSLEELVTATGIGEDILVQVLSHLAKAKIILKNGSGRYDLNPHFKSKKIRVDLTQPIKAEAESYKVLKAVYGDRKYVIQATIMRIMKARKTMKYQPLIQEVISQNSERFTPRVPDIQRAIDALLEKEYMELADDKEDQYNYIP